MFWHHILEARFLPGHAIKSMARMTFCGIQNTQMCFAAGRTSVITFVCKTAHTLEEGYMPDQLGKPGERLN